MINCYIYPDDNCYISCYLACFIPRSTPQLGVCQESDDEDDDPFISNQGHQWSKSLEVIPSSGSDSQGDDNMYLRRPRNVSVQSFVYSSDN